MPSLVFKLISTPLLLAATSLAGRRWGTSVGGALAAVPIVAGSIAFFVSLDNGPEFGSRTAAATLVGVCSLGCYSLVYARASTRFGWPACLLAAYSTVAVTSLAVVPLANAPGFAVFAIAVVALAVASRLMPPVRPGPRPEPPAWDIPARMVTGTVLVVVLTGVAQSLGPQLSGLLAAFPLVFTVLLVFTHRHEGADRARGLLRGFVAGLVATSLFLEIVADGLAPLGVWLAFAVATSGFVAYQAVVVRHMRRSAASGLTADLAPAPAPAD